MKIAGNTVSARVPVVAIGLVVWLLDLLSKQWALSALADGRPRELLGDFLRLRLTSNPGAAFSVGTDITWLFTVIATVIVGLIVWHANRIGHRGWVVGVGGLLGGALGNLTDRLFREPGFAHGHVVDFIALPNFPVFNVADSFITCSVALMFWLSFKGIAWERNDG